MRGKPVQDEAGEDRGDCLLVFCMTLPSNSSWLPV